MAVVIDVLHRRGVGWPLRDDLQAELVVDALGMSATRPRLGRHAQRRRRPRQRRAENFMGVLRTLGVPWLGREASVRFAHSRVVAFGPGTPHRIRVPRTGTDSQGSQYSQLRVFARRSQSSLTTRAPNLMFPIRYRFHILPGS